MERSGDWPAQAERDLTKAELDLAHRYHEWACFTAHQADPNPLKRADPYRDAFAELPFDVWIQVYTRKEVERLRAQGDPFLRSVYADALPVFPQEPA